MILKLKNMSFINIKVLKYKRIFFPEMSIYERYSDKTKCTYFMIIELSIFLCTSNVV